MKMSLKLHTIRTRWIFRIGVFAQFELGFSHLVVLVSSTFVAGILSRKSRVTKPSLHWLRL